MQLNIVYSCEIQPTLFENIFQISNHSHQHLMIIDIIFHFSEHNYERKHFPQSNLIVTNATLHYFRKLNFKDYFALFQEIELRDQCHHQALYESKYNLFIWTGWSDLCFSLSLSHLFSSIEETSMNLNAKVCLVPTMQKRTTLEWKNIKVLLNGWLQW